MAPSVPQAREFSVSPTVDAVRAELGDAAVPPAEIIQRILARHVQDYGGGAAASLPVSWPTDARTASADDWLSRAARLFRPDPSSHLHGKALILALALLDPNTGRAVVASGLFNLLAGELRPPLPAVLSEAGTKLARRLPLAATSLGSPPRELVTDEDVSAVAFHPDGSLLATVGTDGHVRTFELADWAERPRFDAVGPGTSIEFSADGEHLAIGGASGAGVWTASGGLVARLETMGHVYAVAFAPDGALVATGGAAGAALWRYDQSKPMQRFAPREHVYSVAFSPDGEHVLFGLAGEARLHRVRRRDSGKTQKGASSPEPASSAQRVAHSGRIAAASFSPDGTRFVTAGGDGVARMWEVAGLNFMSEFAHAASDAIEVVAFSPDGSLLATGSADRTVRLWSTATGAEIARLQHDWGVSDLAISSDGKLMASAALKARVWQIGLGEREIRLSGYSADDARRGEDLLRIGNDVEAFAQLIAATKITPPLSIGIFGNWGSGKSFFINQLRRRVDELAREARESDERQRDISFYKRIVQVEFNAWHYAESDLWASLVEHILANLSVEPGEDLDVVRERQKHLLEQLSVETAAADRASKKEAEARRQLDKAERKLAKALKEQEKLRAELAEAAAQDPVATLAVEPEVRNAVYGAIAAVGFPQVGDAARELEAATVEARAVVERGGKILAPLLRAQDRDRRFWLLVLVLVAAPALALLAGGVARAVGFESFSGLSAAAAGIATLLTMGAAWLRSQAEWTTRRLDELDKAAKALRAPIERELAQHRQKQVLLEKELESLVERQRAAQREKEAQLDRVREVEAELAAATPSRLLARFLQDRVESDDYRKRLGVLALVRRDFQAISDYLAAETAELERYETLDEERKDEDIRINRIVLYIDDLDRCAPKTVVEVLQAVHLLLAFPLFVVVVAVDVRWVSQSLATRYPDLLREVGEEEAAWEAAAPRDYLEKIFQIPFWIEPLDAAGSRRMLRGLVGRLVRRGAGEVAAPSAAGEGHAGDGGPPPGDSGPVEVTTGAPALHVLAAGPSPADLNPESLDLRPSEVEFMERLAPIVGRTPRAVKRFVNVYRLLKTNARDVRGFVDEENPLSPHRVVMLLLAVETGLPSVARHLLEAAITDGEPSKQDHLVADVLGEYRGSAAEVEEVARLESWLSGQGEPWASVRLEALSAWAENVARFSFRLRPL